MLYVERSNRTERLLSRLSERLMRPSSVPLVPRSIVVQGQGMERFIAQSVAQEFGVLANASFLFPRNLLERVFLLTEEDADANQRWEPDELIWWIARRIAADPKTKELAPLARHLSADDRDWRLVQLAQEIARLFDDYITYRPDWVHRWASTGASNARKSADSLGPDEAWQSWLFAQMVSDLGPGHLADRASAFSAIVARGQGAAYESLTERLREAFPHPLEVFAVSTLPPLYLAVIADLAKIVDVHLSVLSPSRHYWADVWKEVKDAEASPIAMPTAGSAESLLAGLGRLGSDFQRALEDASSLVETDADLFESPDADGSLLERVQRSLLELEEDLGQPVARDDRSVQIHLCHGPKRELEVVKASIRQAFEADPTLRPEDVLVMAPKIDDWVPQIEAVFGASDADGQKMTYRIADRGTVQRSPVAEAFVGLLSLLRGRGTRSEVIDWLALEPARAQLDLDAEGVRQLGEWAARAGVRFGFDEDHREGLGLASEREHTWAGGIDRGVLGHAVGFVPDVFAGKVPEPLPERSDPGLLGALGKLESALSRARRELIEPRTIDAWSEWMVALLADTLIQRDDNAHEHQILRTALASIARAARSAGFDEQVPFEAMQERFNAALESARPAQGFLSGGMTFCELVPLRAIPFRLVAIVGLSDTEFPRRRPSASYDLMAKHPRAGDRNSRSDDRYLFLEALLSARDSLILTVPAKDLRDGGDLPPSVVISELLDVLAARFEATESKDEGSHEDRLVDRLVFEHPLQSFGSHYFEADHPLAWLGLDAESFAGAKARSAALGAGGGLDRRFLSTIGGPANEASSDSDGTGLQLGDLTARLLHSTRTFARERLGMRLPRPEENVSDFDPSELDALEKSQLGSALLADLRSGTNAATASRRLLSAATLPIGIKGGIEARALQREVSAIARIAEERSTQEGAKRAVFDFPFDLSIDLPDTLSRDWNLPKGSVLPSSMRLSGVLQDLGEDGRLDVSFSRIRGRREMQFWIEHLVFCSLIQAGALEKGGHSVRAQSVLVGRPESKKTTDSVVIFDEVPDASHELARLCALALTVDWLPLAFFPRTSLKFHEEMVKGKTDQAFRAAHLKLFGGDAQTYSHVPPEMADGLEFERVWEGVQPLAGTDSNELVFGFDELSLRFFEPLFETRRVEKR